ncbi:MAG: hypothetical protein P1P76_00040 [Anaerolineales bacterium]|nr:hypothetical protein [Anaerolineales bacterium]
MWPEIRKVLTAIGISALAGALLGVLLGGLASDIPSWEFLFWILGSAAVGAAFGVSLAYGFLPES